MKLRIFFGLLRVVRMKNKIFLAIVLSVVMVANIVCIHRAWMIADEYPFKSLPLGTNLHFNAIFSNVHEGSDSVITEINGIRVSGGEQILDMIAERHISVITYQTGSVTRKRSIEPGNFQQRHLCICHIYTDLREYSLLDGNYRQTHFPGAGRSSLFFNDFRVLQVDFS